MPSTTNDLKDSAKEPQREKKTNGLAIASFVLSLCGVPLIGLILGIIALVKIKENDEKGKGLAITAIVLSTLLPFVLVPMMIVGITAGRFAINRANDIAHQNAVANVYEALQAYYADNRKYPEAQTPESLISGPLYSYMNDETFNGGTEATYHYFVESSANNQQAVLVCVSLGGQDDAKNLGYYCDGNGFGDSKLIIGKTTGVTISNKEVEYNSIEPYHSIDVDTKYSSQWGGSSWQ
jgi:hypothetical protein